MPSNYNNYSVSQELADRLAAQEQNANMMGQSLYPQGVPQAGDPLGDFLSNLHFGGQSQLAQDLAAENGIPTEDWTSFMNQRNAETAHSAPWLADKISGVGNYTAEHPAILLAPLAAAAAMGAFGAGAGGAGVGGGATSSGGGVGNLLGQGWQSLGSVSGSIPAVGAPTAAASSTPGWLSSLSMGAKGAGAVSQLMPKGSDAQRVLSTAGDLGGVIPSSGGGSPSSGGGGLWGGIKNLFTNPDTGAPAWGRIAGAGAGALGLLSGLRGEQPTQGPTALVSPSLRRLPLNRTVTGLPSPDDYFTYGQKGGEHQFFSDNALPPMRRGGHYIKGMGSGRSDDIDAKLSNDEYVMDAETVALLGDGSPEEGARRLDELRANIRKHKGQQLAKGKFSADAKRPEEYLRKAKGGKVRFTAKAPGELSQQYRGYWIKHNPMTNFFWLEKDGAKFGSPPSLEAAKRDIDAIVGDEPEIKKAKGGRIRRSSMGRKWLQPEIDKPVEGTYAAHVEGQEVARVNLNDKNEYVVSVHVDPAYRRRGIATALYDHIEQELGHPLKPNPHYVTPEGQALRASRTTVKKAKGGRIRGDWVRRVIPGGDGLRSPLTDAEKKLRLAAVQRFRDALKKPDEKPLLTVVKSRGGAVESLTKFAGELETALNSGQRVAELEQQLNTASPGSAQFFREGFAKGGKIPSLVEDFFKQRTGDPEGMRSIIEELRKLKPESNVLRSYESAQRNKKPLLRDPEALKLLETE